MSGAPFPSPKRTHRLYGIGVLALAAVLAVVSARPYAGSWNDGSRLATVECLVDYHTLAIEDSIFVRVPRPVDATTPLPYPPHEPGLLLEGTKDKLFIDGHFYSDKSPVPAVLMAVIYRGLQSCCGLTARLSPDRFCYLLTLATSGLAYVVAVWCIYQLGRPLQIPLALRLALTASFAVATVALPYSRHVNNHILLLGVSAALLLLLADAVAPFSENKLSWQRLLILGSLAGLGYSIDLAAGPVLFACTLGVVIYRSGRLRPVLLFVLGSLPWLLLHHAVNFAVGGTWKPANAVADYFGWPGCPFTPQNMTGSWQHRSFAHFLLYAAGLLAGKRGFLGHNLPLFLALPGLVFLLKRPPRELPELLLAACWSGGTWLAYAVTSTNSSGLCCSVRWFVPLLAPGYYVLALTLRQHAAFRPIFLVLTGWGMVLAGLMWWRGPWMKQMVPFFWPILAVALLHAGLVWTRQLRRGGRTVLCGNEPGIRQQAA